MTLILRRCKNCGQVTCCEKETAPTYCTSALWVPPDRADICQGTFVELQLGVRVGLHLTQPVEIL